MEDLSRNAKAIILEAYRKGGRISSKSQKIIPSLSFYVLIKDLHKMGIFEVDGNPKGGEEKFWKLTEKGRKIAKHLKEIRRLLHGEEKEG